jgi:histidinol-phosphate aminotransferase
MEAYTPILPFEVLSTQLDIPIEEIVKLDANENPYGAIPQVATALAALSHPHIYPDPESRKLRSKLATHYKIPAERILAGAGADELIDLLLRAVLEPGDAILDCPPTFGMYTFDTAVNKGRVIEVPRTEAFEIDLQTIESVVLSERPKVMFLANPNNPDGGLTPIEILENLLNLPTLIVVDEAYIDFALTGSSLLSEEQNQVLRAENLVVLRTFSKWAGLAGLRVGFGIFPTWLMPALWKIKQPYNLSVAASTAALVSLENADILASNTEKIINERGKLQELLGEFPWLKPYPSQANFLLCKVEGLDAAVLKNRLAQNGILIRYFNKPGLEDHIRISIGKPEETERLLDALRKI